MRNLELAKNPWISDARIDLLREGVHRGTLAVQVVMASTGAPCGSVEILSDLISKLLREPLPVRRVVRFSGALRSDDDNFHLMLRSARDYGFEVQIVVTGQTPVFSWSKEVNWTILRTSSAMTLFAADEIIWSPSDEELAKTVDFDMPRNYPRPVFLHLDPSRGVRTETVDAFLCRTQDTWAVMI